MLVDGRQQKRWRCPGLGSPNAQHDAQEYGLVHNYRSGPRKKMRARRMACVWVRGAAAGGCGRAPHGGCRSSPQGRGRWTESAAKRLQRAFGGCHGARGLRARSSFVRGGRNLVCGGGVPDGGSRLVSRGGGGGPAGASLFREERGSGPTPRGERLRAGPRCCRRSWRPPGAPLSRGAARSRRPDTRGDS